MAADPKIDTSFDPNWCVKLVVVDGPNTGLEFAFTEHSTFVVGRSPEAHFHLPKKDPYVSRLHFMLEVNPPLCRLLDMNSHNGTQVNGTKIENGLVKSGDKIKAGVTTFELTIEGSGAETLDLVAPPEDTSQPPQDWIEWQKQARAAGKPWRVRELIVQHSKLSQQSETLVELIAQEVAFRQEMGETWSVAEYQQDFPAVADVLGMVLESQSREKLRRESVAVFALPSIPGYRMIRELGKGGMGAVYLALEERTGLEVAIKTILPQCKPSPSAVQRFLREAAILARLTHPNIVAARDSGSYGDILFLTMEYVPGVDASSLVRNVGPLPIARAIAIGLQMLAGLEYAHRQGVVHRDLKPSNLLLSQDEGVERVRIADFGLARSYQESSMSGLTMSGETAGTPLYMPPEQVLELKSVKPTGDQYSAAVTLYNLLTAQLPFPQGRNVQAWFKQILQSQATPIESHRPEIPKALAHAIQRGMARKPEDRFSDVAALAKALAASCPTGS